MLLDDGKNTYIHTNDCASILVLGTKLIQAVQNHYLSITPAQKKQGTVNSNNDDNNNNNTSDVEPPKWL